MADPRRAERVRDFGSGVTHEERGLQAERGELHDATRAELPVVGILELAAEPRDRGVEPRVGAGREADLVEECLDARRLAVHGPPEVECVHVARAFPERVHGTLAVQPRECGLLDVGVPADALERAGTRRPPPRTRAS